MSNSYKAWREHMPLVDNCQLRKHYHCLRYVIEVVAVTQITSDQMFYK